MLEKLSRGPHMYGDSGLPFLLTSRMTQEVLGVENRKHLWRMAQYSHIVQTPGKNSRFFAPYVMAIDTAMQQAGPDAPIATTFRNFAQTSKAVDAVERGQAYLDALYGITSYGDKIHAIDAAGILNVHDEIHIEWKNAGLIDVSYKIGEPYLALSALKNILTPRLPAEHTPDAPLTQFTYPVQGPIDTKSAE